MFEELESTIHDTISLDRVFDHARKINALERRYGYKNYQKSARYCAKALGKMGLSNVELIHHPADGVTTFMDCIMPMAWDVSDARLEIVRPKRVKQRILADWKQDPFCIAQWSVGTGPRGVEAELVTEEAMRDGIDIRGKIVLNCPSHHPREIKREVAQRGGIGVVSDWTARDSAPREARAWHNSWSQIAGDWYGGVKEDEQSPVWLFSLSPNMGAQLRGLIKREKSSVKLRATIRTRLYKGTIPTITGVIPGTSRRREEVLMIAHIYEPMPNDNAMGAAGILEIVRSIQLLMRQGVLGPIKRDIRVVFSMEMCGLSAFLDSHPKVRSQAIGAVNIDGIGADMRAAGVPVLVGLNPDCTASIADTMFETISAQCISRYTPWLAYQLVEDNGDDSFISDPTIGIPVNRFFAFDFSHHHTSLDNVEHVDPEVLRLSLTVYGSQIYALATAGRTEIQWLAHRAINHARSRMEAAVDSILDIDGPVSSVKWSSQLPRMRQRLESIEQIETNRLATAKRLAGARDRRFLSFLKGIGNDISIASAVAMDRAKSFIRAADSGKPSAQSSTSETSNEQLQAENMTPTRVTRGPMIYYYRIPRELQSKLPLYGTRSALGWTDGKRNLLQIAQLTEDERDGRPANLRQLLAIYRMLAKYGYIKMRYRMQLNGHDIRRALKRIGIKKNDIIFMHSSLSQCGPIDGGAKTVIDALMDVVSPRGTIVMPTHYNDGVTAVTECGVKHKYPRNPAHIPVPWDPKKSPAETGAIPDAFRQRRDVIRSEHPTHSVAAWGRHAAEIVVGHGPGTPCCGRESPHGKVFDLEGKYLYFGCSLNVATFLHALEDWADLGYMPVADVLMRKGTTVETVKSLHYPEGCRSFYSGPPNKVTRKMDEMNIKVDSTGLGLSELQLVGATDFHRLSSAFDSEPDLLLCDREGCLFCTWARKQISATRRE